MGRATRAGRTLEDLEAGAGISVPNVTLLNQNGKRISLRTLLDSGNPLVIDFISTRCSSICPILSQGFTDLREKLGKASRPVQLVSISTDPDADGPEQMKEYLEKYKAGEEWNFLTGNRTDITLVMKALDASAGNNVSPLPFYYLHNPNSDEWVRIKGTAGSTELLREIRKMDEETKAPRAVITMEKPETKPIQNYGAMIEFIPVKGGCYRMGDKLATEHEYVKPEHEVCVDDFSIGKYDVTVGDFKRFVDDTYYRTEAEKDGGCWDWTGDKWKRRKNMTWRNAGFAQDERHPVVCVSWNDARAFAEWLSSKTGRKYRLPSEAEWEYAARSGGKQEQFAGFSDEGQLFLYADFCDRNCVFVHKTPGQDDGYPYTAPVGVYKSNGLGLNDMTGNVWQWLNDWYGATYYEESPKDNPMGPSSGEYKVLRGGSWLYEPLNLRATHRFFSTPSLPSNDVGFRLVSPGR
jgi:formylglycine-generating enzyme required for sulfatase activity